MTKPKLVLLNGFAGCGKSTIAKKYVDEHPLAMNLEGDKLIVMLGQWKENWDEASRCKIELSKNLASTHLSLGYDVVVPFLLTDSKHAEEFEKIAEEKNADFFEIMLSVSKEEAVARLLKRGKWSEEGSVTFTEKDLPDIEKLYDDMEKATSMRPNTINIFSKEGEVDKTYEEFITVLGSG